MEFPLTYMDGEKYGRKTVCMEIHKFDLQHVKCELCIRHSSGNGMHKVRYVSMEAGEEVQVRESNF
jgi:hypothetical protein